MPTFTRRDLITKAGLLGAASALQLPRDSSAADAAEPSSRKLNVVITGGHPGDPEYGCGGTAARYADLGHHVTLLYLNRGEGNEKAPEGKPVRSEEARAACKLLGAEPLFASQIDGKAIIDAAHYEEFRKMLAEARPDVVFTQWPIDHHPDHRAVSLLTFDAWVRLGKKFSLYYYEVSTGEDTLQFQPTHYVDISGVVDRKRAACFAHATQSPERYYALQEMVAKMRGLESGHAQAEAFIRLAQSPDFSPPLV